MTSIILKHGKNHPKIIAYQSSNNFGDQIIQIFKEEVSGFEILIFSEVNHEGNWRSFDKATLNKLF